MRIAGSAALVTGGASGLGEATVRRLHAGGARVLIADIDEPAGLGLADELGPNVSFRRTDITQADEVQAAVDAATTDDGLRISVSCAGIGWAQKIVSRRGVHPLEHFARVVDINLVGTFNVLRCAAAAMIAAEPLDDGERGICINTASIAGYDGQIGQAAYAASKAGVIGLTLPAARELAASGVRVCAIAPGLFDTPLLAGLPPAVRDELGTTVPFPARLGHPAEYALLAGQIIENRMLNGEVIRLDGALRMPPS